MNSSSERIVFTGSGIVCGSGATVAEIWARIESGESSIDKFHWERGRVRRYEWDSSSWPCGIASEVKEDNRTLVPDRKLHKTISRKDMYGIYASEQAIKESGVLNCRETMTDSSRDSFNDRSGLIVGSGGANYHDDYDFLPLIHEVKGELNGFGRELSNQVTPMWLLRNLPNNVLCHVGIQWQLKGTNACITNQCASSPMAVAESASAILNDEADRIVAVGHDSVLEPEHMLYYETLGLLSREIPKPFDASRSGTVFGEGGGAIVLEKQSDAVERGAEVIGEFLGFGSTCEATGTVELNPTGEGLKRAIEEALENAGLVPSDVGMICAHGNGTKASDLTEGLAIESVFGENIPPVTAFKWAYGHLIGAAGIVDLIMTLESLKRGIVPGVSSFSEVDPQLAGLPVGRTHTELEGDVALVICRAFGGLNVVLAVRGAER